GTGRLRGAQEVGNVLRQPRVETGRGDAKSHLFPLADWIDPERAATRDGLLRDDEHVEQKLDPVLGEQQARQIPDDGGLAILDMAPRHGLRIAEIDLRAGGPRSAERQAAELQAGRGGLGALADQVECEVPVFGLGIVVKDLKPIDDRPNGTDEIVADPRTKQSREFERIGNGTW